MRDFGILALRLAVGGYLAVHGAQKLLGAFNGPGLDQAAAGFEQMGLAPGKPLATLAGTSELAGGVLTATGLAYPLAPLTIASAMAVAVAVHSDNGPMGQKGGYELPLTDLVASVALAATGPGRYSLDRLVRGRLPRRFVWLGVVGATAASAYCASKVMEHKRSSTPPGEQASAP
jgi:putative oxidoreductase